MTVDACIFSVVGTGFGPLFAAYDGWIPIDPVPGHSAGQALLSEALAGRIDFSELSSVALLEELDTAAAVLAEQSAQALISDMLAHEATLTEAGARALVEALQQQAREVCRQARAQLDAVLASRAELTEECAGASLFEGTNDVEL